MRRGFGQTPAHKSEVQSDSWQSLLGDDGTSQREGQTPDKPDKAAKARKSLEMVAVLV